MSATEVVDQVASHVLQNYNFMLCSVLVPDEIVPSAVSSGLFSDKEGMDVERCVSNQGRDAGVAKVMELVLRRPSYFKLFLTLLEERDHLKPLATNLRSDYDAMKVAMNCQTPSQPRGELQPGKHHSFSDPALHSSTKTSQPIALGATCLLADFKKAQGRSTETIDKLLQMYERHCIVRSVFDVDMKSLLHIACDLMDFRVVKLLVEKYNFNPNDQDIEGNTALHIACKAAKSQTVMYLLALPSCNPNLRDREGKTAFHLTSLGRGRNSLSRFFISSNKMEQQVLEEVKRLSALENFPEEDSREASLRKGTGRGLLGKEAGWGENVGGFPRKENGRVMPNRENGRVYPDRENGRVLPNREDGRVRSEKEINGSSPLTRTPENLPGKDTNVVSRGGQEMVKEDRSKFPQRNVPAVRVSMGQAGGHAAHISTRSLENNLGKNTVEMVGGRKTRPNSLMFSRESSSKGLAPSGSISSPNNYLQTPRSRTTYDQDYHSQGQPVAPPHSQFEANASIPKLARTQLRESNGSSDPGGLPIGTSQPLVYQNGRWTAQESCHGAQESNPGEIHLEKHGASNYHKSRDEVSLPLNHAAEVESLGSGTYDGMGRGRSTGMGRYQRGSGEESFDGRQPPLGAEDEDGFSVNGSSYRDSRTTNSSEDYQRYSSSYSERNSGSQFNHSMTSPRMGTMASEGMHDEGVCCCCYCLSNKRESYDLPSNRCSCYFSRLCQTLPSMALILLGILMGVALLVTVVVLLSILN